MIDTDDDGLRFRGFQPDDRDACLSLFDANCPEHFSPNERAAYAAYLADGADTYDVCVLGSRVVGAFGVAAEPAGRARVTWILLDPACHGHGLGGRMMRRSIAAAIAGGARFLDIAASHRSAAFFARFGARETRRQLDGWGPGMHRVDMELALDRDDPSGFSGTSC